jgi:hypothetical protein
MKKWMKKQQQRAAGTSTETVVQPIAREKGSDCVMAFVAKGPAQESYTDMLATLLGSPAKGMGHFSLPERGGHPYSTAYAFRGFMDEAAAIEAKLAASPIAEYFQPELIQCSPEEHSKAERSTSTGELPVISVAG